MGAAANDDVEDVVVVDLDEEVDAFRWIEGNEESWGRRGNCGYGGVEGFEGELSAVAIVFVFTDDGKWADLIRRVRSIYKGLYSTIQSMTRS